MRFICFNTFFFLIINLAAQDSTNTSNQQFFDKYISYVSSKAADLENKLDKKAEKALSAMAKEEAKLKKKLQKKDSVLANSIFGDAASTYKSLKQKLGTATSDKPYIPFLDTLKTSIKFLEQNPELIAKAKEVKEKLTDAMSKVKGLEDQFQKAENIKKFLKERKQYLKEQLSKLGFVKQLKKINKQVYYYSEQLKEYKAILQDPKKIEKKAIEMLAKTKVFQNFMKKNSMLASLFGIHDDISNSSSQVSLAGLQTRVQVNQIIQQQISSGGPNVQQQLQQNMQSAQAQIQSLKDKISQLGRGNSDAEIPDFKPNNQKVKSFLKRLEYGANIQTQKATSFFPITSDIGLSLGYKLNDKNIIGVGASYKVGMGTGWRNIRISHQGLSLRSYADVKLKGSFWFSGGYEQNYMATFSDFNQLQDRNAWQQSGLLGLSKKYKMGKKFNGKMQLLWDFLSYQQLPRTQPIVFRFGFSLK
jgi:hypothetical protein